MTKSKLKSYILQLLGDYPNPLTPDSIFDIIEYEGLGDTLSDKDVANACWSLLKDNKLVKVADQYCLPENRKLYRRHKLLIRGNDEKKGANP